MQQNVSDKSQVSAVEVTQKLEALQIQNGEEPIKAHNQNVGDKVNINNNLIRTLLFVLGWYNDDNNSHIKAHKLLFDSDMLQLLTFDVNANQAYHKHKDIFSKLSIYSQVIFIAASMNVVYAYVIITP